MIVRLHDGVVMGHDDLFAAHDAADEGAFGELDFGNGSTDDARSAFVAMNDGFERFRRSSAQRMHPHHIAPAHVSQERADGDGLRRDGDIDAAAFHELGVGRLVDERHHFVRAQSLGEHRRQNVGLFRVRQGGEDVRAVDVLLDQQLLVRGVAVQDDGVLEKLRHPACALAYRAR